MNDLPCVGLLNISAPLNNGADLFTAPGHSMDENLDGVICKCPSVDPHVIDIAIVFIGECQQ